MTSQPPIPVLSLIKSERGSSLIIGSAYIGGSHFANESLSMLFKHTIECLNTEENYSLKFTVP